MGSTQVWLILSPLNRLEASHTSGHFLSPPLRRRFRPPTNHRVRGHPATSGGTALRRWLVFLQDGARCRLS